MKIPKQTRNILVGIVTIAIVFSGYTVFFKDDAPPDELLLSSGDPQVVGADFVALLYQLKAIRLDLTLFDDPAFRSLENFGTTIAPEPVGNRTPFAPLPDVVVPKR